jgi:hypothetical protein
VVIAASVAVVVGALAGAMGQEQTGTVAQGSMSVGQTSTTTTAPTTIPVPVASPVLKASLAKGYANRAARAAKHPRRSRHLCNSGVHVTAHRGAAWPLVLGAAGGRDRTRVDEAAGEGGRRTSNRVWPFPSTWIAIAATGGG